MQLWQCMADAKKLELCTLGLRSNSRLEVLLEAAKESVLIKINMIAQRVKFSELLYYEAESIRTFLAYRRRPSGVSSPSRRRWPVGQRGLVDS